MTAVIRPSEEISHRTDFALLANARGYKDAVEVGVDQGVFARDFLSRFQGNWLFLVDPYEPYPDFPYDRSGDQLVAAQALAPYHGRFRFVKARSVQAAPWVARVIHPDFVYVDGAHEEDDVRADLEAWWAVLPPDRGMLAGHDYDTDHPGVMLAVNRFAQEHGLIVRLTHEKTSPPSWYVYRREPDTLVHKFFQDSESPNPAAVTGARS